MASQQEVDNIIDGLIIDNTTGYVNPSRLRQVLKAINQRAGNDSSASNLTAVYPINIDALTGVIDYKVTPFKAFRPIAKGWKPGTTPTDETVNYPDEALLGDFCFGTDVEGYFYITRWVTGSGADINNVANHKILFSSRQPLPGEPGFEE